MYDVQNLLRQHLKDIVPYSSARDDFSGDANIFLDANENAIGSTTSEKFNRYPDPRQNHLKAKLEEIKGIDSSRIFIGNGSDEIIDLLIRAFCEPKEDCIVIMPPTYGMYKVTASINNVRIGEVPLTDDFQINENLLRVSLHKDVKIIFICSPNNPTGNDLDRDVILHLLEDFEGLVVVDEAYIDFSKQESLISAVNDHPNLVVMQTFSKAWGLASLRVGMAFAQPSILNILNRIKPPYNISGLTQEKVIEALANEDKKNAMVESLQKEKENLVEKLSQVDFVKQIYPSNANFVLARMEDANDVYLYLIDEGVVVRNRSNVMLCDNCLRITVGTFEENEKLIEKLNAFSKV